MWLKNRADISCKTKNPNSKQYCDMLSFKKNVPMQKVLKTPSAYRRAFRVKKKATFLFSFLP